MAKKTLIAPSPLGALICTAFVLAVMFAGTFPAVLAQSATNLEEAKAQIRASLEAGDAAAANAVLDSLLPLPDSAEKGQAIQQIAAHYKDNEQYEKGIELSRYVLTNWPDEGFAVWCRMQVAWSYVFMGDLAAGDAETEKLITDYADDPNMPWAVSIIAELHFWLHRYDRAVGLYDWLVLRYPESSWAVEAEFGSARSTVLSLIQAGEHDAAVAALGKLVAQFRGHQRWENTVSAAATELAGSGSEPVAEKNGRTAVMLWEKAIAETPQAACTPWAYHVAGDARRALGDQAMAIEDYRQIVENWPGYDNLLACGLSLANCYATAGVLAPLPQPADLGSENRWKSLVNLLIDRFDEDANLALGLLRVGGTYYAQGTAKERSGFSLEAARLFVKAAWVYEQIIARFKPSETTLAAKYFCADCYVRLGRCEDALPVLNDVLAHTSDPKYTVPVRLKIHSCYGDWPSQSE